MTSASFQVSLLVSAASLSGLFALRSFAHADLHGPSILSMCILRDVAGIPCPACGGMRSVTALAEGDILAAIGQNPATAIAAMALVISPLACSVARVERALSRAGAALVRPAILRVLLALEWGYIILRHRG